MENLFSYGTLQYRKVQIETFGRILNGTNDILIGYKLKELKIKNQDFLMIFIDFHGFSWNFMDFHGFSMKFIDFH